MGAVSSCRGIARSDRQSSGRRRHIPDLAAYRGFSFTGFPFERAFPASVPSQRVDGTATVGSFTFKLASSAGSVVSQLFGFRTAVTAKPGGFADSAASRAFPACTNAGAAAGCHCCSANRADAFYRDAGLRNG